MTVFVYTILRVLIQYKGLMLICICKSVSFDLLLIKFAFYRKSSLNLKSETNCFGLFKSINLWAIIRYLLICF